MNRTLTWTAVPVLAAGLLLAGPVQSSPPIDDPQFIPPSGPTDGPPDGIPGRPPDDIPGGPPDDTPGGPPDEPPGGPPDDPGGGPPWNNFIPPGQDPDFVPPGRTVDGRMGGAAGRGGPSGRAGFSSIARLTFAQLDPDTGEPLMEGPWALLIYRWESPAFDYVFNAHELFPGDAHTLTYQPQAAEEPILPAPGVICLGEGEVNDEGNLHLEGVIEIETDLPADYDANEEEAILALVPSADVDCDLGEMVAWFPEEYLFGTQGMFYVDTGEVPPDDDPPDDPPDDD